MRYEAGSIFFEMRRRNVVRAIWVQPCAAMPPENETFIYLLSCLKIIKKKGETKIYACARLVMQTTWCVPQKFLFDLFLSPVN